MVDVKIVMEEGVQVPSYQTEGAAGCDVRAFIKEDFILKAGERAAIPTGIKAAIPTGYEIQVRPRSGLVSKNGITVLNTPGTIDSDYRGEVKVILINTSEEDFVIHPNDRIAQFVLAPVIQANFVITENLDKTERGDGGFGHTGI